MRLHREHSCDDGLSWSSLLSAAPWRSSLTVGQPVIPRKFFVVDRLDMIDRERSGSHVSPSQRGFVPLIRRRLELDLGTLLARVVAVIPRGCFRPRVVSRRCFYYTEERVPYDKLSLICNGIIECFTLHIFLLFLVSFLSRVNEVSRRQSFDISSILWSTVSSQQDKCDWSPWRWIIFFRANKEYSLNIVHVWTSYFSINNIISRVLSFLLNR